MTPRQFAPYGTFSCATNWIVLDRNNPNDSEESASEEGEDGDDDDEDDDESEDGEEAKDQEDEDDQHGYAPSDEEDFSKEL